MHGVELWKKTRNPRFLASLKTSRRAFAGPLPRYVVGNDNSGAQTSYSLWKQGGAKTQSLHVFQVLLKLRCFAKISAELSVSYREP